MGEPEIGDREGKTIGYVGNALDCRARKVSARLMVSLGAKLSNRNGLVIITSSVLID